VDKLEHQDGYPLVDIYETLLQNPRTTTTMTIKTMTDLKRKKQRTSSSISTLVLEPMARAPSTIQSKSLVTTLGRPVR
jgi:hypothetical protein